MTNQNCSTKAHKFTNININFISEKQYRHQKLNAPRHMSKPYKYKIYDYNF